MVARTQTIRFTPDRAPSPKKVRIGYEGDNLVERLIFVLPTISEKQTGFLMIGEPANIIKLIGDGGRHYVDLTASDIGQNGTVEAYIRLDGAGGETWNSGIIRLLVGDVPNTEIDIEREYPNAVSQMLSEMARHDAAMDEHREAVEDAVTEAEAAKADAGAQTLLAEGAAGRAISSAQAASASQAGAKASEENANAARDQAGQSAYQAGQSAERAAASQQQAANSASMASVHASGARQSAIDAQEHADSIGESADKAENQAETARSAADQAAASANIARDAADRAAQQQVEAANQAAAAGDAAGRAASSAQDAQAARDLSASYATNAASSSASAAQSATQAATGATNAANSASAAAQSANAADASAARAEEAANSVPADYTKLTQEVSKLSEEIAAPIPPERTTFLKTSKNIFSGWAHDECYVNQLNGKLTAAAGSTHKASDYIAIKPDTSYTFSAKGTTGRNIRYALYDTSKTFISGAFNGLPIETPGNAAYVIISYDGDKNDSQLEEGTEMTEYEPYSIPYFDWQYISNRNPNNPKPQVECKSISVSSEYPVIFLNKFPNSIKQGRIINMYVATESFDRAVIFLKDMSDNNILEISIYATQVVVSNYMWGTPTVNTYNHGLTISGHVGIKLVVSMDKCSLTVSSAGATFTQEWSSLIRGINYPTLQIAQNVGTAVLSGSWTCSDFDKKVWVYGDSYIQNDGTRWMYHLIRDGYNKNCLIDGYSGAGSNGAMTSLENTIALGYVPKYIFWAMGMNDGTDSDDAPSATWMKNIDKLMAICEYYNIRPVLATIPSVPNINHEAKNAWVRASGHQYVDFAAAVNATPEGVWLDGMLSSDNVHPAAPGGLALYHRVLSDFPQIMIE